MRSEWTIRIESDDEYQLEIVEAQLRYNLKYLGDGCADVEVTWEQVDI